MSQVTVVVLSDGTNVDSLDCSPAMRDKVARAFTELFDQIKGLSTDVSENDALIDSLRAQLEDAKSDSLRLHSEKIDLWVQVRGYEAAGWKLVPVEPTVEMKIAGDNAGFWCGDKYAAMLKAAPKPEQKDPQ